MIFDVPVTPDADTARLWAITELAKPGYHGGPTLFERLMDWIDRQTSQLLGAMEATTLMVIVAAVVVSLVVAIGVVSGPVRRSLSTQERSALLADDARSAAQIRAAASAAAQSQDWALATAEWFRAMVRDLEERTVLAERPGWTADEAARVAAARLPDLTDALEEGAGRFDEIVYGDRSALPGDEQAMRSLAERARRARPVAAVVA
jgi:hypothetical protein